MINSSELPWYRQFWPWFLIALPGSVVVACFYTTYLALVNPLSIVQDDYYKEGLAINQNLAAQKQATSLGLHATISVLTPPQLQVHLIASATDSQLFSSMPILLSWSHPVDQNKDLLLPLTQQADGSYRSALLDAPQWSLLLQEKRWYITLQDANKRWSLRTESALNLTMPMVLMAQPPQ